jgi:integrative and conjugative element protein (TIGR02256 family)
MIAYAIPGSEQRLVFPSSVLNHLAKHRQTRWYHREAGGQLFARFALPDIVIEEATGPRRSDWRTRYSYRPNRRAEQREITRRHSRGLHFIGDWHTHPEAIPSPSSRDIESMCELFTLSEHALNGFVLAIVGREAFPLGMSAWLYTGSHGIRLRHKET